VSLVQMNGVDDCTVSCRTDEVQEETFSVYLQVLISQSLQPTFIDELTTQHGMKSVTFQFSTVV